MGRAETTPGLVLTDEQEVSEHVEGLKPDWKYTVCLIVENAEGHGEASAHFETALEPEKPVTEAATANTTGTTATLNGELNPKAIVAAKDGYYFTYGSGGTCEGFATTPGAEPRARKFEVYDAVKELEGSTEFRHVLRGRDQRGGRNGDRGSVEIQNARDRSGDPQ